jgi:integrase
VDFTESASAFIASRASKETRAAYGRDLRLWLARCAQAGADPAAPPLELLVAFRDELVAERAPLSSRRTLAALSSIYGGILPGAPNPFAERALPRPPASDYSRTQAVSDRDAQQVIAAAGERGEAPLRDVALLLVLYNTGMRRISVVSIRRDAIEREGRLMTAWHYVKGGKEKPSEFPPETASAVEAWLGVAPPSPWLFCTLDGLRLSPQGVTKIVASASRAAGLHIHPHQFRSAFITKGLDAKIPLPHIQAAAHHEDPRSTLRYDRGQRGAGVTLQVAAFRASLQQSV